MDESVDAIVIGAGPAGLATAAALQGARTERRDPREVGRRRRGLAAPLRSAACTPIAAILVCQA